jgi:phage major head subunit gpT-like protein
MLITPASLQALQTSFSTVFGRAFRAYQTSLSPIAMTVTSSTKTSTYGWMSPLFKMRKWLGPRVVQNLKANAYMIENEPYEATLAVDRDEIEDDQLGLFNPRVENLAAVGAQLPDQLLLEALLAGETGPGFDSVAFFATTHNLDPAGNQANIGAIPFNPGGWAFVRATMASYTGEDGLPLGIMPNLVIIPPEYEMQAAAMFGAATVPNGGTNVLQGQARYIVVPELAGTNAWYAFDVRQPIKPFIFQVRRPIQLVSKTAVTDDNVFWQKEFVWGIDGRFGVGYGPWFTAFKSTDGGAQMITTPPAGYTDWSFGGQTAAELPG